MTLYGKSISSFQDVASNWRVLVRKIQLFSKSYTKIVIWMNLHKSFQIYEIK